jgi:nucleoside-diphosphate kinase
MILERTLILVKPDAIQRNLLGEIITRFERKGLKIVGLKMIQLGDALIEEHYRSHKEKSFFSELKKYMQSAPVVAMVLEGHQAVSATRLIVGPTKGYAADAGSIRGDLSISGQTNIVHASDSLESAQEEVGRFFEEKDLIVYTKIDELFVTASDERTKSKN